jgi:hypothetical protein
LTADYADGDTLESGRHGNIRDNRGSNPRHAQTIGPLIRVIRAIRGQIPPPPPDLRRAFVSPWFPQAFHHEPERIE